MLNAMIAMVLLGVSQSDLPLLEMRGVQERLVVAQGGLFVGPRIEGRFEHPDFRDMIGFYDNGPHHGTIAPDFELQPLEFYEFGIELEDITEENAADFYKPVRLSDFRGHKPVVLIFGSYT